MTNSRKKVASTLLLDTMKHLSVYDAFLPVCTKEILDIHSFDPNMLDQNGDTPLLIACHRHHFEIVKWLIELGAMPDPIHPEEMTPLCAVIAPLFLEYGEYSYKVSEEKLLHIVEYLVAHGAKVNDPSGAYSNALLLAAQKKYLKIVDFLIKQGAEISNDHPDTEKTRELLQGAGFAFHNREKSPSGMTSAPAVSKDERTAIVSEFDRISQPLSLKWHAARSDIVYVTKSNDRSEVMELKSHLKTHHVPYLFGWYHPKRTPSTDTMHLFAIHSSHSALSTIPSVELPQKTTKQTVRYWSEDDSEKIVKYLGYIGHELHLCSRWVYFSDTNTACLYPVSPSDSSDALGIELKKIMFLEDYCLSEKLNAVWEPHGSDWKLLIKDVTLQTLRRSLSVPIHHIWYELPNPFTKEINRIGKDLGLCLSVREGWNLKIQDGKVYIKSEKQSEMDAYIQIKKHLIAHNIPCENDRYYHPAELSLLIPHTALAALKKVSPVIAISNDLGKMPAASFGSKRW